MDEKERVGAEPKIINILICDDYELIREGLKSILSNYHDSINIIGEAVTGEEAIRMAGECKPDVILMDIVLPGIDGIEATRAIKKAYKDIKIIALTRFRNKEFITSIFQAGGSAYLTKSVTKQELVDAIKEVYHGAIILHRSVAESLEQIIADAAAPNTDSFWKASLSLRESEVLSLIAQGMSNKDIAKALYLSGRTVQNHVSSIFRKLRVHDRTAAALYVIQKTIERNALKDGPPLLVDFEKRKY